MKDTYTIRMVRDLGNRDLWSREFGSGIAPEMSEIDFIARFVDIEIDAKKEFRSGSNFVFLRRSLQST